jgi:tripartite-type tricarboxylate transporter receptor subunit TctC
MKQGRAEPTCSCHRIAGTRGAVLLALAIATLATAPAGAQDFPARTVTIVVPFVPGGTTDLLARLLAGRLEQRLGKPFVVENKPGAGALTAMVAVARAVPDGHTIMVSPSSAMAANVTLYKKLPYDPAADFVPLALLVRTPFVLAVNPALGVRSVADLVKLAKDKPGALAFASSGPGTPHHLFAELFQTLTGTKLNHVPYKGVAPALNDVVAGHVQVIFTDVAPALALIRDGKLTALGVTSKAPVAALPGIAPLDAAVSGFDATSWQMAIAPAATPAEVVATLNREIGRIVAEPEIKAQAVELGMLPVEPASSAELRAFVQAEIGKWATVVRNAGIAASQ